jgi:hypothetical protein
MAAFSSSAFSTSAFSTAAFDFGAAPAPVAEERPRGMPAWIKKKMVEDHLRGLDEKKRLQYVKRIALLLLE